MEVVRRPARPYVAPVGAGWLPWSAASLASGAVLLVMGSLVLPPATGVDQLVGLVEGQGAAWSMAALMFFLAAIGLTMGLPAILFLFPGRDQLACLVALWTWAIGTIGTAGLAGMVLVFQAAVDVGLTSEQVGALVHAPALVAGLVVVLGAFYAGEVVLAVVLLRARVVARWVPVVLLAHVACAPLIHLLPGRLQGMQTILLGVALMGVAMRASEAWAGSRTPSPG
jgi:hypothetical protein